jgi:antitoxin VapB
MALNIKDPETERLAREVAELTGESKTAAVRTALRERKERLAFGRRTPEQRERALREWLEREVWPSMPPDILGKPLSKEEEEELLGYGEHGV